MWPLGHLRGLFSGRDALTAVLRVKANRRSSPRRGEDRIVFGGEMLEHGQEKLHFAVTGSTGSGTSTLLQLLMQQSLASVGKGLQRRAVIYDAKQNIYPIIQSIRPDVTVHLMNPFDRRSSRWAMWEDVDSASTAHQVASIFVPPSTNLSQPFFENMGRDFLAGILRSFLQLHRDRGVQWDLRDVINASSPRYIARVLKLSPQNNDCLHHIKNSSDAIRDVLSTLATKLSPLRAVAALWHRACGPFTSLTAWSKTESILVLGSHPAKSHVINPINHVLFHRMIDLLTAFPDAAPGELDLRRTWVFLDELDQLGKLPELLKLFSFGRSKGACAVIGFQSVEGLYQAYQSEHIVNAMLENARHKALLAMESDKTAKWAAGVIGEVEELVTTGGSGMQYGNQGGTFSRNQQESFQRRFEVLPSEFLGLPLASALTGIPGFYTFPGAWKRFDFNPFTNGMLTAPAGAEGFAPTRVVDEDLAEWEQADLDRLSIQPEVESVSQSPHQVTPSTDDPSLFSSNAPKRRGRLPR